MYTRQIRDRIWDFRLIAEQKSSIATPTSSEIAYHAHNFNWNI